MMVCNVMKRVDRHEKISSSWNKHRRHVAVNKIPRSKISISAEPESFSIIKLQLNVNRFIRKIAFM